MSAEEVAVAAEVAADAATAEAAPSEEVTASPSRKCRSKLGSIKKAVLRPFKGLRSSSKDPHPDKAEKEKEANGTTEKAEAADPAEPAGKENSDSPAEDPDAIPHADA